MRGNRLKLGGFFVLGRIELIKLINGIWGSNLIFFMNCFGTKLTLLKNIKRSQKNYHKDFFFFPFNFFNFCFRSHLKRRAIPIATPHLHHHRRRRHNHYTHSTPLISRVFKMNICGHNNVQCMWGEHKRGIYMHTHFCIIIIILIAPTMRIFNDMAYWVWKRARETQTERIVNVSGELIAFA